MRLVQLITPPVGRRVAQVAGNRLEVLAGTTSIYSLAKTAITRGETLTSIIRQIPVEDTLDYDQIYVGGSDWKLLPAFDHPHIPAHCRVSGTGLTHLASASNRQAMHVATATSAEIKITDSLRMFRAGLAGGDPAPGQIGIAPEWFYKGDGACLRAHGETIVSPAYADDGGEEPEIAGCYLIGPDRTVHRVGHAAANEFSDHVHERKNYLYLAESKLRPAALGPELLIGDLPRDIAGQVRIERGGHEIWSASLHTGAAHMCHSPANIEHHHFKHPLHRQPGDAHIHFFGADHFSFGDNLRLESGDHMVVSWPALGRPLRNALQTSPQTVAPVRVATL